MEMSKLSWFNYNEMINDIVEVNVNLARAPIDFVGDNISKVKGYVVKRELVRQPSERMFVIYFYIFSCIIYMYDSYICFA